MNRRGLTLIEMLAVIAIIAILFVLLVPQISSAVNKARESGIMIDFRDIQRGVENYAMENQGGFKSSEELNRYLDGGMEINEKEEGYWHFGSNIKTPFGGNYSVIHFDKEVLHIAINKYSIYFTFKDGRLLTKTTGFAGVNIGEEKRGEKNGMKYIGYTDGEAAIYEYDSEVKNVEIPGDIEGYKVTIIGNSTFLRKGLTDIKFNENLKYIGGEAFNSNKEDEIIFPNSLTSIAGLAFVGLELKKVEFGENMVSIGRLAFVTNKIERLVFEERMDKIGVSAFADNPINYIKISNKTNIRSDAFGGYAGVIEKY